jgi:translocation and assembly module TamB
MVIIKKILKYSAIGTGILLFLIILLAGLSQTRWFKNQLLKYTVNSVNEKLKGQLSVGTLKGNLFNHLDFSNICLISENDTVLFLPKLSIDYSLLNLLRRQIRADSILLNSPQLLVRQHQDNSWNITRLFKDDSTVDETSTTQEKGHFGYTINLKHVALRNAQIHVLSSNSPLPEYFRDLNMEFSGYYGPKLQELNLIDLNFSTGKPEFYLDKFSFSFQRKAQLVSLRNMILKTRKNVISGEGDYQKSSGSAIMQTEPLDFKEFEVFLPDLNLRGNPSVTLNTSLFDDSISAKIDFIVKEHAIGLSGWLSGLRGSSKNDSHAGLRYALDIEFNRIRLAEWVNVSYPEITLNGLIHLQGKGITAKDAKVKMHADLSDGLYNGHRISHLTADAEYLAGNLNSRVNLLTDFGRIELSAKLTDILSQQKYVLNMDASGLNLAEFVSETALNSDLNFHLSARGEGLNIGSLYSHVNLRVKHSIFSGFPIDSLLADGYLTGQDVHINELLLAGDPLQLRMAGKLSKVSENNFEFDLTSRNLASLTAFIGIDSLQGSGSFSAHVRGQIDSLSGEGHLNLTKVAYHGNELESLASEMRLAGNYHRFSGFVNMNMAGLNTPAITMDQVTVKSDFTQDTAGIALDIIAQPDLEAHLISHIKLDSFLTVTVPLVSLQFRNQKWSGGTPQMKIIHSGNTWQIDNFRLNSQNGKSGVQEIQAKGIIRNQGPEKFHLTLEGLDLQDWSRSFRLPVDLSGVMNLNAIIEGTADSPVINSTISLDSGSVNQIILYGFHGSANYQERQMSFNFSAFPTRTDSLTLEGFIPFNLSLAELPDTLIPMEAPLNIRLNSNSFPLSIFDFFSGKKQQLNGNFQGNLVVTGTPLQPYPEGSFMIGDAFYVNPNYGVDIKNIELGISLSPGEIVLEKFLAKRDNGTLSASGKIDFMRSAQKFSLQNLQLNLQASQFYLSRNKNQEIQLDGNIGLGGDLKNLQYNGNTTIPRASIYLPAFLNTSINQSVDSNERLPLLIQAQQKLHWKNDSLWTNPQQARQPKGLLDTLNIFKNLSGTLKIHATRNTWLKQSNMAVELSYDLEISKKEEEPEIFGKVEILRGYYNLLGRRFNLKDSYVYFEGGKELNPRLDIPVEYTFRTSNREKRTLKIYIRGNTKEPIISFYLNEKEIEESDAFSYVIYGRSPAELSAGEQSDLNSTTNIMASYLSGQLGSAVGNMIGVDELEINSEDNWQSASVRVGKYLSTDLYVSYEQRFGEDREGDIIKKLVTLEYEISRNILVQLVGGNDSYTGFDFIFKYDRE